MAAFNFVRFRSTCPSCGSPSNIEAQMHVGASFDGDDSGRFCSRAYSLGDRLLWFGSGDRKYTSEWRESATVGSGNEVCYANRRDCNADLYAVIVVKAFVVAAVEEVGREEAWPSGYSQ